MTRHRSILCQVALIAGILSTATGPGLADSTVDIDVPVLLGDRYLGDATVRIDRGRAALLAVDRERLIQLLQPLADEDRLKALRAETGVLITLARLSELGLEGGYQPDQVQLTLKPGSDWFEGQALALGGGGIPDPGDYTTPGLFSAYVNFHTAVDYVHRREDGQDPGREPLVLDLDGALRVGGYTGLAVEGAARFREDAAESWTRGDVRAVFDHVPSAIRFSAGDLFYGTSGFQAAPRVAGLSVERNYDLHGQQVARAGGRQEFILERRATVKVYVAGTIVQTLRLEAGRYDVRDLPLAEGANDVRLEIEDETGRTQVVTFTAFLDNDLLEVGRSEFSYNAGIRSRIEDDRIRYDSEAPIPAFSLFHRYGLASDLTVGANVQGSDQAYLYGTELTFATRFGTVSIDLASSRYAEPEHYVLSADYRLVVPARAGRTPTTLDLSFDLTGERFRPIDYEQTNPAWGIAAARLGHDFGVARASLAGNYSFSRTTANPDSWNYALTLSRNLGPVDGYLTFDAGSRYDRSRYGGFVGLRYRFGPGHAAGARYGSRRRETSLDWSYASGYGVDSYRLDLEARRVEAVENINAGLDFWGNRIEGGIDHQTFFDAEGLGVAEDRSRLRLATALGFVDGAFGVGRPIRDSFAIVRRGGVLADQPIAIDPTTGGVRAESDLFGDPLITDLTSYSGAVLDYAMDQTPIGTDTGPGEFRLLPAFRSGFDLAVGTNVTVSAIGRLHHPAGGPVVQAGGRAYRLDQTDPEPILFFTNRAGRFALQGLKPGRYRLQMVTTPVLTGTIEIPDGAAGLIQLGPVQLAPGDRS